MTSGRRRQRPTLKLDLRVLRLPEDPADWLLEHSPEEFAEMLTGAVPVLEYGIRRIVARTRGRGCHGTLQGRSRGQEHDPGDIETRSSTVRPCGWPPNPLV